MFDDAIPAIPTGMTDGALRSRRALLLGAIGGAAALAAGALGRPTPAWAGNGDPITIGAENTGTSLTLLTRTAGDAFIGSTAATASAGVVGLHTGGANGGYGVRGSTSSTVGIGVLGVAGAATGLGTGVSGSSLSPTGTGVYGDNSTTSGLSSGVTGHSASSSGRGVIGRASSSTGTDAIGVEGFTNSAAGAGVKAINNAGGVALRVQGQVTFSSAGLAIIPAGSRFAAIGPGINITAQSKVLATLQSSPGGTTTIHRVYPNPSTDTVTIFLTANATQNCTVAWFVIS